MPIHTDVKFLHSQMEGAPQITSDPGSLNKTLEIVLIHGFGEKTLTSLAVTGNVATATLAGHGFERYTVVKIAGATEAQLNGIHRITDVDTDWFKFETVGVSDTTETGIKVSYAPLGQWSMPFHSDTKQEAIFKSTHPKASRGYYYIKDAQSYSSSLSALVEIRDGVESLTKFAHRTYYSNTQDNGRIGYISSNRAPLWWIWGDDLGFYFSFDTKNYNDNPTRRSQVGYIGDFNSFQANDEYNAMFYGTSGINFSGTDSSSYTSTILSSPTLLILRGYRLTPQGVIATLYGMPSGLSGQYGDITFPNGSDNALFITGPFPIEETASNNIRGILPGLYSCPQNVYSFVPNKFGFYSGVENFSDDGLLFYIETSEGSNTLGVGFFNATKWRS